MRHRILMMVSFFFLFNAFLLIPVGPGEDSARADSLRVITVNQAREMIQDHRGDPLVLLIYRSTCPKCRKIFDSFIKAAAEWQDDGVYVLALAVDAKKDVLEDFLYDKDLPFEPLVLKPWPKGALGRSMSQVGIHIGATFYIPFMSVIDDDGEVVIDGVHNVGAVKKAVKDIQ